MTAMFPPPSKMLLLSIIVAVSISLGSGSATAQTTSPTAANELPAEVTAVQALPRFKHASWGLLVIDSQSGAVLDDQNAGAMFIPGSTTKIFTTTAALNAYGPDYRFETPVYRTGSVSNGVLSGNLILVASGDPTMGGRNTPEGTIDFRSIDHINANAIGDAQLTPENPLAGLNDLAAQIARSGIRKITGNVIVDTHLYPTVPKDDYILSPIMINDNLIDLIITPSGIGRTATVAWRPRSSAYVVKSEVKTVGANEPALISSTFSPPNSIVVQGQIPAGKSTVRTFQVTDPGSFARTLFIDALRRHNIAVSASSGAANPNVKGSQKYLPSSRVAVLRSLPFSEVIKLVLKVSHNQIADTLIELIALKNGKVGFEEGVACELPFLKKAGVDDAGVSLGDGRGNDRGDVFTPQSVATLLEYMTKQTDFEAFRRGLPLLGVDGTEFEAVASTSAVRGKASVKTGAVVVADLLHDRPIQLAASMAGYLTAQSGRRLIVALYINNITLNGVEDVFAVDQDMGKVYEGLYDSY